MRKTMYMVMLEVESYDIFIEPEFQKTVVELKGVFSSFKAAVNNTHAFITKRMKSCDTVSINYSNVIADTKDFAVFKWTETDVGFLDHVVREMTVYITPFQIDEWIESINMKQIVKN